MSLKHRQRRHDFHVLAPMVFCICLVLRVSRSGYGRLDCTKKEVGTTMELRGAVELRVQGTCLALS